MSTVCVISHIETLYVSHTDMPKRLDERGLIENEEKKIGWVCAWKRGLDMPSCLYAYHISYII